GYSSLNYLKRFPVNILKVDRSFINDLSSHKNKNDGAIVRTILTLGQTLGMKVVAEGVESFEQLEYLRNNGCLYFQGYLFGKPMPLESFESSLRERTLMSESSFSE
ncbi:MAG: EAL domain-containing protein, partial [Gammaproteobacteria bacterium]